MFNFFTLFNFFVFPICKDDTEIPLRGLASWTPLPEHSEEDERSQEVDEQSQEVDEQSQEVDERSQEVDEQSQEVDEQSQQDVHG